MSTVQGHWDGVWQDRDPDDVSWFQARPALSFDLVDEFARTTDAPIVDVGGGASRLVDLLLDAGYEDVTVVDVADAALAHARQRLGARARDVRWVTADVRDLELGHPVAVWHDRAVFHFLTDEADRRRYVERLEAAVRPGGHAVIATFAADGPEQCSGLPVRRHDPDDLTAAIGDAFEPVRFEREVHVTPWDSDQAFTIGVFRRRD